MDFFLPMVYGIMEAIMTVQSIKSKILPILKSQGVTKAGFFGSLVRHEEKKNSDIDIVIEFKDNDKTLLDFVGLKLDLEDKLKRRVDLVEYSALHPLLKEDILKEQVPIL